MVGPSTPDAGKLAAFREALPAVGAGIYLDTPVAGPLPAEAAAAMSETAGWELTTGRVHRDREDDIAARVDEARAAVAAILVSDLGEVALAPGIEAALGRAVRTVDWQLGDRLIVVDDPDLRRLADVAPPGVDVVLVGPDADPASIGAGRLAAVPLVSALTGARLPVETIAAAARAHGGGVVVDVSLGVGAVPVDRQALGADVLVARSEAWLLGPEGLAVVVGRDVPEPRGPARFHVPSVAGFARACGWLSMYVGLPWIHARIAAMVGYAAERLGAIPGVSIVTPPGAVSTLVFRIEGWAAADALAELGARVFLLASALPPDALRIGVGAWTTEAELDRLGEGVELLARHGPDSLPRRRLTILGAG